MDLVALRHEIDALELEFSRQAYAFAEAAQWDDEGFNTPLDWIRLNCHMTSTAASDRLAVGGRLAQTPESVQAMSSGEIGFAHIAVMARTANAVRGEFDETKLLDLARESSPGKFHFKCLHYRHAVNAEQYAREQEQLYEERSLRLSTTEDGCLLVSGILDPVSGAAVRSAIEPLARPCGAHDDRKVGSGLRMRLSKRPQANKASRCRSRRHWKRSSTWSERPAPKASSLCRFPPRASSAGRVTAA